MPDEMTKEREKELNDLLSKAKLNLYLKKNSAYIISLMNQTNFVWASEYDGEPNPTAMTDGFTIWWNPDFFMYLKPDVRVTVLAHELWHIGRLHMDRMGTRESDPWNIACDHPINLDLKDQGYSFESIEWVCMNDKYRNMSTEQIYAALPKQTKADPRGMDLKPLPSGSSNEDAQAKIIGKIVAAVQYAQQQGQAGTIPGEITLILDKFLYPKLPWETLLRHYFSELQHDDYSYRRPSRRYEDEILPGMLSDDRLTEVNYYLDISGSVSDADILRFNSEVAFIKREFNPEKLNLITFDTKIRDIYTFTEDMPFEKIIVTGRGGTSLVQVHRHILETKPDIAVIFSDLECDVMASVGRVPVLWVVVGNKHIDGPYGTTIHIDNEVSI